MFSEIYTPDESGTSLGLFLGRGISLSIQNSRFREPYQVCNTKMVMPLLCITSSISGVLCLPIHF